MILKAILMCLSALLMVEAGTHLGKIKHVIVLMEENQSFDHMMGWYNRSKHSLTGNEYNLLNASDPTSKRIYVSKDAPYINFCDPDHTYPATQYKIFGPQAYSAGNFTDPLMSGFVDWEHNVMRHSAPSLHSCGVMKMFDAHKQLPIMTSLADEFVLMDKFFCSLPGPTWPNRLFFLAATSAGLTETIPWYQDRVGELFPVKTIFDQIEESGGSWSYYYDDTPWEMFVEKLAHSPEHTHQMERFFQDAKTGNLPNFAFINPRNGINLTSGLGSNDQHPDHDVALGEALYKSVYEALRNSPQWNETLFVLTYDEHGGFYDHITPSVDIPSPNDFERSYPDKFNFTRGGIRIPTLLASPWLKKGTILSDPPASGMPTATSYYELTSIMATVRKLLPMTQGLPPLTPRDGWAATFEHLFAELDAPRTDCPVTLPPAPPPTRGHTEVEAELPVNGLQSHIMEVLAGLTQQPIPAHITKQRHVQPWATAQHETHRRLTFRWKDSKQHRNVSLEDLAYLDHRHVLSGKWAITEVRNQTHTLSTDIHGEEYCIDIEDSRVAEFVTCGVSLCYPSKGKGNRDRTQQWLFDPNDNSIRPAENHALCLTNHFFGGIKSVRLETCNGNRNQHYAYFSNAAPGMGGSGDQLFFGAWMMTQLVVVKK